MEIKDLKAKRQNILEQAKDIVKKAKDDENRSMTKEEDIQFNKWMDEHNALTATINSQEKLAQLEAESTAKEGDDVDTGKENKLLSDDPKELMAQKKRAMRSFMNYGQGVKEDEVHLIGEWKAAYSGMSSEERALTVGTATSGGHLLLDDAMHSEIIKSMAFFGPYFGEVDQMAARLLRTAKGNQISIPTNDDTSNSGSLVTEGGDVSGGTDHVFGEVVLNAYKYTSKIVQVNSELEQDSEFPIEEFVFDTLAERTARALNTAFTTGTGSSQPQGKVTGATQAKVTASQTAFTRSEILDLIYAVDRAYRVGPKVGFEMHDSIIKEIAKLSVGSGDNRPLWQPSLVTGQPDTLEGYRYWINNDMASALTTGLKTIIFGDHSKFFIREVLPMVLRRFDELYGGNDRIGFAVFSRWDSVVVDTAAIKYLEQT